MTVQPEPIWDVQAQLGEGALWDERDRSLWFTDIKLRKIHCLDPSSGDRRTWDSPEQVGFVVPARSGGFIAGLQSGLHRFDPQTGRFDLLVEVESDRPGSRLNDAVVDPSGRLWFGTMDDNERAKAGAFYCFAGGELRRTGIGGIAITNGPAVSPDGAILYWVDTLGGKIFAAAIGGEGALGQSRLFARIDPADGHPDGPTVDSDGCVWIALYGGWEARRYSPSGELLDRVRFPVANLTKLALGGPGLRTAYATSARQKIGADELAEQPLAGALFAFPVAVAGIALPAVADS